MSGDTVIKVENLSKAYTLGHEEKYDTFFGFLGANLTSPFRKFRSLKKLNTFELDNDGENSERILWALNDVSFEAKRGEVLGVIGRNGAGKSTLLKILSRIAEPTKGRVEISGRVSALLEVGTGFHPELTGRENIFLNGTILGMKKTEIDRNFDAIVDFSGVEKFLDTPIKRYSSGMKVRLAFAVSAHLDPEILIVDEVLAVGDSEFQKKCLGKMNEVATGEGRTILFVSHNMAAVRELCDRAIQLNAGKMVYESGVDDVVNYYLNELIERSDEPLADRTDRAGSGEVRIVDVAIAVCGDEPSNVITTGSTIKLSFLFSKPLHLPTVKFTLYDELGTAITGFDSDRKGPEDQYFREETKQVDCTLADLPLVPGRYHLNIQLSKNGKLLDHIEGACFLIVAPGKFNGRPAEMTKMYKVMIPHTWGISA